MAENPDHTIDATGHTAADTPVEDSGVPGQLIQGTGRGEFLTGTAGNDSLLGGGGSDILFGQAGDDALAGGPGNDGRWRGR